MIATFTACIILNPLSRSYSYTGQESKGKPDILETEFSLKEFCRNRPRLIQKNHPVEVKLYGVTRRMINSGDLPDAIENFRYIRFQSAGFIP